MNGRPAPRTRTAEPSLPPASAGPVPEGARRRLLEHGPAGLVRWMHREPRVLIADTTMHDAHRCLISARLRTRDMLRIAPHYARLLPGLFAIECWGVATFDVAMRFLDEDPWLRLARLRAALPGHLLQVLVHGTRAVGCSSHPENAVRFFIRRAAMEGIDLFRIVDPMNKVDSMQAAIDAVRESGAVCEGAIRYAGVLPGASRLEYELGEYIQVARRLERAGVHMIAIKDTAGVCNPSTAKALVVAVMAETGLPVRFHTHDTGGAGAASALAAIEGGAVAVDAAMGAGSGLVLRPDLGVLVAALAGGPRDTGLDPVCVATLSRCWEDACRLPEPCESDIRTDTDDVSRRARPGSRYTDLREVARATGVSDRCSEFGFPRMGGPVDLSHKMGRAGPISESPDDAPQAPLDLEAARARCALRIGREADDRDLSSWLMYPQAFERFARRRVEYGDASAMPTSDCLLGR